MSQLCMVCGKATVRLFKIKKTYGTVKHTIEDDMVEIFGPQVSFYLGESETVCNVCMNMLDNFSKLKRRLWQLITKSKSDRKPIKFEKIWNIFASMKVEEEELDEEVHPNDEAIYHQLTPSTTGNQASGPSLLTLNYSEPYNNEKEAKIERREYYRSRSKSRSDTSDCSDRPRRKREKRKGYKWSRHKNSRSCYGALSDYASSGRRTPSSTRSQSRNSMVSDESELEMEMVECNYQERRYQRNKRHIFICEERDCPMDFLDLDVLNYHVINDHKIRDLFICNDCGKRYTMKKHLQYHWRKTHDTKPFFCLMCQDELPNVTALQQHLDKHMTNSYPCCFCDRSFISRSLRKKHIKILHPNQREQDITQNDFFKVTYKVASSEETEDPNKPKQYRVFIMLQADMSWKAGDLDVTKENLVAQNVEVFTGDGMVASDEAIDWITEDTSVHENNRSNSVNSNNVESDFVSIVNNYGDVDSECANEAINCDIASDLNIERVSENLLNENFIDELEFNVNNLEIEENPPIINNYLDDVGMNENNSKVSDHETDADMR